MLISPLKGIMQQNQPDPLIADFLSGIAEVLPGALANLPPLQLFVLLRAVCIFIQLYAREFTARGKVKREFTFYIDGRQITAGERKWNGEATVTVAIPQETAYTTSIS